MWTVVDGDYFPVPKLRFLVIMNWCEKHLKHGDRVKKLSGNVWKYRSDHPFFDRFPLAWWQVTQNLLAEKIMFKAWCLQQDENNRRRLNSDWFTGRRHFAWLTSATLAHPGAFRGRDVLECESVQFACPLTLPVFCRQLPLHPSPLLLGVQLEKQQPWTRTLVAGWHFPWLDQGMLCCFSEGFSGQATEFPHRCFCCARHFFTPCLRRNGVACLSFPLHVVFSCIGNACPFLGL